MDRQTAAASTAGAGGSRSRTSSPASRTSAAGDDVPDASVELPRRKCKMHARRQALSELDVVEDIIEGFSIASFNSLEDLQVRTVSVAVFDLMITVRCGRYFNCLHDYDDQ